MRHSAAGHALAVAATLVVAQAAAEPVPPRYHGIFGTTEPDGGCAATAPMVLVNGTMAVAVNPSPEGSSVIMGKADWAGGVLLLYRGDASIVPPPLDSLDRCARPPATLSVLFGEALALFRQVDALREACSQGRARGCVDAVIAVLDVAPDNRLSPAEIARGVRAAAAFFSYEAIAADRRAEAGDGATIMTDAVSLDAVYAGSFGIGIVASFGIEALLAPYDYDGDGFLDAAEILQDREQLDLATLTAALGVRLGENSVRSLIGRLPAILSGLMGTVGSLPFGLP